MANEYLKPQIPLKDLNSENYFYPLTTIDQIILQDNSTRLNSLIDKSNFSTNKAIYYDGTKLLSSENIFLNNNQIAINKTSITEGYNFEVNGNSLFNNNVQVNGKILMMNSADSVFLGAFAEQQLNKTNVRTWCDTATNIHKSSYQGDMILKRFFSQDEAAATYNLPCVDSHMLIFSIDGSSSINWTRILALDMRSPILFIGGKNGATWQSWTQLITDNTVQTITAQKTFTQLILGTSNQARFLENRGGSTVAISDGIWNHGHTPNGHTNRATIWHQRWTQSGITYTPSGGSATANSDCGDMILWLSSSNTSNVLQTNLALDGDIRGSQIIGSGGRFGYTNYSYNLSAGSAIFTNTLRIQYNTPNLIMRDTQTAADTYTIIRLGNKDTDNGAYIFLNGPSRTNDGGANMMTIRNNVGNLRLDDNTYVTGRLEGWNHFLVYTKTAGNAYNESGSAIQVREVNLVGNAQSAWTYAPKIGFHWSGRVAMQLGMNSSQELCLYNNNSTNVGIFRAGTFKSQSPNGLRLIYGSGTTKAVLLRNDGTNFWILNCNTTDTDSWYQYPLHIDLSNGYVYGSRFYNAVWNDYAEFRKADIIEPGYVVKENGDGSMSKAEQRLQLGAKIISDTYGFAIGQNKENNTPIAVSGRVLVYTYQDRNKYQPGMSVCAAPGGTVDIMTREEIQKYPDAIIGIVSEIPNYETWKAGNYELIGVEATMKNNDITPIQVNDRIWVYVR